MASGAQQLAGPGVAGPATRIVVALGKPVQGPGAAAWLVCDEYSKLRRELRALSGARGLRSRSPRYGLGIC